MSETTRVNLSVDASGLSEGVREAGVEIDQVVRDDIAGSLEVLDEAFEKTASNIERSLNRAARTGKFSFEDMSKSIVRSLSNLAVDNFVRKPLEKGLSQVFSNLPFGGARAGGGAVAPGAAYLVGERGPELFTPRSPGRVMPGGASNLTVNFNVPPGADAETFRQSEAQIAAMLARAVGRGGRNM
ncbi:MAG: phage tail tape measure C-terminal domain-containing protein [Pseudomonadota bacterium]